MYFKNTNTAINWSFCEFKLEICEDEKDLNIVLEFYNTFSKYGEWVENFIKPIAWMKIEDESNSIKSKTFTESKKSKKFKITIYFETTIQSSPFGGDYFTSNSYWINCIGGLYPVVDLYLFAKIGDKIEEGELCLNYNLFHLTDYRYESWKACAIETGKVHKNLLQMNKERIAK